MRSKHCPIVALATALLALIVHGVAGAQVVANDHDSVDGSPEPTAEALIASDPELAALEARDRQLLQEWTDGLACALLASEDPLLRVRASVLADWDNRQADEPLACRPDGEVSTGTVRHAALRAGWHDPAVVYQVLRFGCTDPTGGDDCDRRVLERRLADIDADNLVSHFLPLLQAHGLEDLFDVGGEPTEEEWRRGRRALLGATGADRFDLYTTAGVHDAYRAIRQYAETHPVPAPSEAIRAVYRDADDAGTDPWDAWPEDPGWYGSTLLAGATMDVTGLLPWRTLFNGLCERAAREKDKAASDACAHVADVLIASPHVPIAMNPGHDIRRRLEDPSPGARDDRGTDWQRWLRTLVYTCEVPKQTGLPSPSETLPDNHYALWQRDLQELGERDAIRRAAMREYAVDPSAFVADPARCRDALELDAATRRGIVEAFRPEGSSSSSMEAGLAALGEALKQ